MRRLAAAAASRSRSDDGRGDRETRRAGAGTDAAERASTRLPAGRLESGAPTRPAPRSDEVEAAREIALRQLTVRARSRGELERTLSRKQVAAEDAAVVLDRLTEVGLVDDVDFARQWLAAGARRGRGRRALAAELAGKGVPREVIAEAMAELEGDHDYAVALEFAQRKLRSLGSLTPQVRQRRLFGALARRGFSASVTAQVIREVLADFPDETEDLAD